MSLDPTTAAVIGALALMTAVVTLVTALTVLVAALVFRSKVGG